MIDKVVSLFAEIHRNRRTYCLWSGTGPSAALLVVLVCILKLLTDLLKLMNVYN